MAHLCHQPEPIVIRLQDKVSVFDSDTDIDLDSIFRPDNEGFDESPFILSSLPPQPLDGERRWYSSQKELRRVEFDPSEVVIDSKFSSLRPRGATRGTFSLLTTFESLSWLNPHELRQLMAELNRHKIRVTITRLCRDHCAVPVPDRKIFKLTGDAAYVLSVKKQHAHTDEVNELIATNPCYIVPQLRSSRATSRRFPLFFTDDHNPSLAAQVALSTRIQIRGNPMYDLVIMIDLIARNLRSQVEHMDSTHRRRLDSSNLTDIAWNQASMVKSKVSGLASDSLRAGHINREAYSRMLAIGDTLVPAALYQVGAQLQNQDARHNALYKDVFGLAVGAALAAVPYGASASSWVSDIGATITDNLQPVRDTVGSMDLVFKLERDRIKRHAAQLSGKHGRRNQQRAQELRWYASEMKHTWKISTLRMDVVGEDGRAARFAGRRNEADRRRNKSVVDLVKALFGRDSRE